MAPRLMALVPVVVFAYALFASAGWGNQTRLFPVAVAVPGLILAVYQLSRAWARPITGLDRAALSSSSSEAQPASRTFAWILGVVAAGWLFGFPLALPAFAFIYLLIRARAGWLFSSVSAVGTAAFLRVIFDLLLHTDWPTPLVVQLLAT